MDGLPVSVNAAIVGIGSDEAAAKIVVERLGELGHRFVQVKQLAIGDPVLPILTALVEDPELDVVLVVSGDVGSVRDTLDPLVTRDLPGFAELFRIAAFEEIGSSAMLLDADAARCGDTFVFVLPNLVGAVKVALDRLLIPQLDTRTRPISLASKFPRLRALTDAPTTRRARTQSGSGVPPIAPAPVAPPAVRTDPGSGITPIAPARTVPPPVPRTTETPPIGIPLRPPAPVAAAEPELMSSDAAIPIPPAVIVDEPPPATPDQAAAFVASLEAHAREVRRTQSQAAVLPRRTKTEPPPLPVAKKTDAESKAERDAQVAEAISKVEPLPTVAPPARAKNLTTPQQWAQASNELAKLSSKPGEPTLAELQSRDRAIAVPRQRSARRLVWVPVALVLGAGAGLVFRSRLSGDRTASAAEPSAPTSPPIALAEPAPAEPAPPPANVDPAPAPLGPEPPIEITVDVPGSEPANLTSLAQAPRHHHVEPPAPAGAATGSDAVGSDDAGSDDAPDPRTHPDIAPASPDCDEASCILDRYARECCARYKPAEAPAQAVRPDGPPETLDKDAVKAGLADLKPAVQQCGEAHPRQGIVKVTLTVDADGHVREATVADAPDPELGTCVASVLRRASFERTRTGAVFTYPFAF